MNTIIGENNWRLTVRRNRTGIEILRAATCDARAALPDALFGLPVAALGSHALAPDAAPAAGEEITLTGFPGGGAWDNRALCELTLPPLLESVGDYALMGCRSLHTLRLTDRTKTWGTAALMNCRALGTVVLERVEGGSEEVPAYFIRELSRELDLSICEGGRCAARLIFPEYFEEYVENNPAHHFDYKVSGAGQPYHQVFRRLNYYDYDRLWPGLIAGEHEPDTALRLAWWRVWAPEGLSEDAGALYWAYLTEHAARTLAFLLTQRDTAMLSEFLRRADCSADALRDAAGLAREHRDTAALAVLLEALRRAGGAAKTFDL